MASSPSVDLDDFDAIYTLIKRQRTSREHLLARLNKVPELRELRLSHGPGGVLAVIKLELAAETHSFRRVRELQRDMESILDGTTSVDEDFEYDEERRERNREALVKHRDFIRFWAHELDDAAKAHMVTGKKPYLT